MLDKLVQFLIDTLDLFRFWVVVQQYQEAALLRFGKFKRKLGPGLHWQFPFGVDHAPACSIVLEALSTDPQSLTTKDDVGVVLSAVVTFRTSDIELRILEVEDAISALSLASSASISRYATSHTWQELLVMAGDTATDNPIAIDLRRRAKRYGIQVHNLQLRDFTKSRSYRLIHGQHVPFRAEGYVP